MTLHKRFRMNGIPNKILKIGEIMKKYYKVVREIKTQSGEIQLQSARSRERCVHYKIGEWTVAPEGTRVFVFDDLNDAHEFCLFKEGIYECRIFGGIRMSGADFVQDQGRFWEIFNELRKKKKKISPKDLREIMLADTPAVLAKKVMLLRKIV